ncbi:MAG TPA: GAF domain-containing protein [Terriglobales bacterium]
MQLDRVKHEIDELARTSSSANELMNAITKKLNQRMLKYNWVGFYMISAEDPNVLELGPFVGAMTPHTRIALNQGICGAAASKGSTVVVDDVSRDARYLACSKETKSEIVVPVFVHGKVVGELDIDSHFLSAFGDDDRALIEYCAQAVGRFLARQQPAIAK